MTKITESAWSWLQERHRGRAEMASRKASETPEEVTLEAMANRKVSEMDEEDEDRTANRKVSEIDDRRARTIDEMRRYARLSGQVAVVIVNPHGSAIVRVRAKDCLTETLQLVAMVTKGMKLSCRDAGVMVNLLSDEHDRWELLP